MSLIGFGLFMLISILIVIVVFLIVTAMMLNSSKLAVEVMKQELEYLVSKKKKEEKIKFAYEFLNDIFRSTMVTISQTKDEELMKEYKWNKEEVRNIKDVASQIAKKDSIEFISEQEVRGMLMKNNSLNFIDSYSNSIKILSQPGFYKLYNFSKSLKNKDELDFSDFESIFTAFNNGKKINYANEKTMRAFQFNFNRKINILQSKNSSKKNNSYLETIYSGIFNEDRIGVFVNKLAKTDTKEMKFV